MNQVNIEKEVEIAISAAALNMVNSRLRDWMDGSVWKTRREWPSEEILQVMSVTE